MSLDNKVVLITGGAKRIGKALVEGFAKRGAWVAFTYNTSQTEAKALETSLKANGCNVMALKARLGVEADVDRALERIEDEWGGPDILINSASDFYATPLSKITAKDWEHFIQINLVGSAFFAWKTGVSMKKRGFGKIINIADWASERPYKNYLPYTVSKSGILGLTKGLALELAPEVCVNAISPGPILPPEKSTDADKKELAESVPLKRIGSPNDILTAALFLADEANYVTGAVLPVEGGRLLF